jgi:hypothetical protein
MLLVNKNYKSLQTTTTTHSHSENPSSQMQEIMYLDVDLQREATIATKEESLHHLQRRSMPSHSNDDVHYM